MHRILILDFGSQFTQLIARRIRELGVYAEILPANSKLEEIRAHNPKGIILSGGPHSVFDPGSPQADPAVMQMSVPVLGICYGMQWMGQVLGGKVEAAHTREYGFMPVNLTDNTSELFRDLGVNEIRTWMSHGDEVKALPQGFRISATSASGSMAAMENSSRHFYAVQFHPEVTHTEHGLDIFRNFLALCQVNADWDLGDFAEVKAKEIAAQV
ncbi:MAG: glutamine-hydrolyzing GMP synthase, partial [Proteobacteria bacterium]